MCFHNTDGFAYRATFYSKVYLKHEFTPKNRKGNKLKQALIKHKMWDYLYEVKICNKAVISYLASSEYDLAARGRHVELFLYQASRRFWDCEELGANIKIFSLARNSSRDRTTGE